jgi:hypothetical protein
MTSMGRPLSCRSGHRYPPNVAIDSSGTRICPICSAKMPRCAHCGLRPVNRPGHPFCSKACSNAARGRPLSERFLKCYKPGAPDACWPWLGTCDKEGYGVIMDEARRQLRAHRIAYERINGPVPPDRYVLHACDNPPCCNPAHLFVGSIADNNADKRRKLRHPHGVTHPLAKLTEDDVRAIRGSYPRMTQTAIAKQYGLDQTTVSDICRRKIWRHI